MSIASIKSSLIEFHKTRDFESFYQNTLQNRKNLDTLIDVSLDLMDDQSAIIGSWVCTHLVNAELELFQKNHRRIVHYLMKAKHQSSLRHWMKILSALDIDEDLHGSIIDICCQFISDSSNKVALQIYSMYTLANLLKYYPELLPEMNALIELHSEEKSPAYAVGWRNFKKITKKIHPHN